MQPKASLQKNWPADIKIFHLPTYDDKRGSFQRGHEKENIEALGLKAEWHQDNFSTSKTGVFRGFHYQDGEMAQGKFIKILQGRVIDFFVDLRPDSPTYTHMNGIELSAENSLALWLPRGFAHGFLSLEPHTIMAYKCDNAFSPDHATGFRYDDPSIDTNIEEYAKSLGIKELLVSEQDLNWKPLKKLI